jgi:hypothetical protein
MNVTEIDATLSRLRGASDAMSANLMELDADPNRMLLDSAGTRPTARSSTCGSS